MKKKEHSNLEPAASVIALLGGPKQTAIITGKTENWVSRWPRPEKRGGTGGKIPYKAARKIVAYVRAQNIEFPIEKLFDDSAAA